MTNAIDLTTPANADGSPIVAQDATAQPVDDPVLAAVMAAGPPIPRVLRPHCDLASRAGNATSAADVAASASTTPVTNTRDPRLNPEAGVRPWGSPMSEPVPRPTSAQRPDTGNAWGRSETTAVYQAPVTLARFVDETATPLTLVAAVPAPPLSATYTTAIGIATIALAVWLVVEYGNGSTTTKRVIRADDYLSSPILASYCQVSAYIAQLDGAPVPSGLAWVSGQAPTATVTAFLSRGVRGLPMVASLRIAQDNPSGTFPAVSLAQVAGDPGPSQVLSFSAHLATAPAGNAPRWIQFFDSQALPANGTVPKLEYALPPVTEGLDAEERYLNPVGFSQGVTWANSSTSGTLTAAAEDLHTECELLQL